jgi:hypothetical protein
MPAVFVVAARMNVRQLAQILCSSDNQSIRSSLFWPRADSRKPAGMLRPAQSLQLSSRARTHAARSPLLRLTATNFAIRVWREAGDWINAVVVALVLSIAVLVATLISRSEGIRGLVVAARASR